MILTVKTDNPEAAVGLFRPDDTKVAYHAWRADRQLAKELLSVMHDQLAGAAADWAAIKGVIVFEGPGSFTGLRIGISVANAIAYGLGVPIVAAKGDDWLQTGLRRLNKGDDDRLVLPHYGAEANISLPKK